MRASTVLLLVAIGLAGCTGTGTADGLLGGQSEDTGATALTYSFKQLETFSLETEDIALELEAENVGQADAEDVTAELFGRSWITGSRSIGTLEGVDRAAGQSGGTGVARWQLSPPDVDDGQAETFDATARVTYIYETTATMSVELSPDGFVTSQSEVSAETTDAPVKISTDLETPIPTQGASSHSIPITIENVGGGDIVSQVDITGALVDSGNAISLSGCDTSVGVDQRAEVSCSLETPSDGVSFDTAAQVRINARYEYREETSTTVTVRGVQN